MARDLINNTSHLKKLSIFQKIEVDYQRQNHSNYKNQCITSIFMDNFSLKKRILSFRHAFNGIWDTLKHEQNAWIHTFATLVVVAAGFYFDLARAEWILIVFAIGMVFMAEWMNTAIEHLGNAITKEQNPHIKRAKDAAAGGVLIAAIAALIIGLLVFLPHLY
jgi:diacylglycerol kinase (ATP)